MNLITVNGDHLLDKLRGIILKNLGNGHFGVSDLAEESGLGKYVLKRKIFKATNKTTVRFITEIRLQKALQLLKDEDLTASEVAFRTGFCSPSYFNACFHDFFGFPPGKARHLNTSGVQNSLEGISIAADDMFVNRDIGFSELVPANTASKSIAVLPFTDISAAKDQEYLCDGLAEEIINTLVHLENLKVIARTSSFAFKNSKTDIREIGKTLNVENILEGSIRREGNHLRIIANLINAVDGTNIWSDHYDRNLTEVFLIQEEISRAIADALKINLINDNKPEITRRHSSNLEAYNLYLKGNYNWQMLTKQSITRAVGFFEQALAIDSSYALAYAGLSSLHIQESFHGNIPPNDAYPRAVGFLRKALDIDRRLPEAYSSLATIETFFYWNWEKAEFNFRKALAINPNSAISHLFYSFFLSCRRRFEEALAEIRMALELDPISPYINSHLALLLINYKQEYDKAIDEFKSVLATNSNYFFAHLHLGTAYFGKSMITEAGREWKHAVELSDELPYAMSYLSAYYYFNGERESGDIILEKLRQRSETEYVPAISFFLINKARMDEEEAFKWFRKAIATHDSFLLWYLISPMIDFSDQKYRDAIKQAGLTTD